MFSCVFCDDMKLICDSPPSRHSLMLLSSWGFGLHSSRRNLSAQAGLKFWMIWKSYMWIAEWRIKWRMIIFIYATFAVAKRKPEKKKKKSVWSFSGFLFATAKVAYKTATIILHLFTIILNSRITDKLTKDEGQALRNLKKRQGIIIKPAEKGSGTVVLDKSCST